MSKTRRFTFTIFGMRGEDELRHFMTQFNTKYWCAGDEVCPTSGRQHWQGWLYLTNPRSLRAMIKSMKPHHVEIMHATADENDKYCQKDGKWISEGTRPAQGERGDLVRALQRTTIREHFALDEPNFQSIRVLEKKLHYCEAPKFRKPFQWEFVSNPSSLTDVDNSIFIFSGSWHGYDGQKCLFCTDPSLELDYILSGIPRKVDVGGGCARYTNVKRAFTLGTEQKSGGNTGTPDYSEFYEYN